MRVLELWQYDYGSYLCLQVGNTTVQQRNDTRECAVACTMRVRVAIHNSPGFIENGEQENPLVLMDAIFNEFRYKILYIRIRTKDKLVE